MVHVVWFKRDLRTLDHAPLVAASLNAHVLPLYVVEPSYWQHEDLSGRHFQFVQESLVDLDKRLHKLGNNPYITPIVDYETLLKSSKELLYGIKKTKC
jgi:deoxyribodipyrimidine photo-lyase